MLLLFAAVSWHVFLSHISENTLRFIHISSGYVLQYKDKNASYLFKITYIHNAFYLVYITFYIGNKFFSSLINNDACIIFFHLYVNNHQIISPLARNNYLCLVLFLMLVWYFHLLLTIHVYPYIFFSDFMPVILKSHLISLSSHRCRSTKTARRWVFPSCSVWLTWWCGVQAMVSSVTWRQRATSIIPFGNDTKPIIHCRHAAYLYCWTVPLCTAHTTPLLPRCFPTPTDTLPPHCSSLTHTSKSSLPSLCIHAQAHTSHTSILKPHASLLHSLRMLQYPHTPTCTHTHARKSTHSPYTFTYNPPYLPHNHHEVYNNKISEKKRQTGRKSRRNTVDKEKRKGGKGSIIQCCKGKGKKGREQEKGEELSRLST